jgi:hypothetical protein
VSESKFVQVFMFSTMISMNKIAYMEIRVYPVVGLVLGHQMRC